MEKQQWSQGCTGGSRSGRVNKNNNNNDDNGSGDNKQVRYPNTEDVGNRKKKGSTINKLNEQK